MQPTTRHPRPGAGVPLPAAVPPSLLLRLLDGIKAGSRIAQSLIHDSLDGLQTGCIAEIPTARFDCAKAKVLEAAPTRTPRRRAEARPPRRH